MSLLNSTDITAGSKGQNKHGKSYTCDNTCAKDEMGTRLQSYHSETTCNTGREKRNELKVFPQNIT